MNARRMTKMYITFSVGNGIPNTVCKQSTRLNESRKSGFEGTFSPTSVVLLSRLFPKRIGFTHDLWVDPYQPFEFHEKRFKTATCIVHSYS